MASILSFDSSFFMDSAPIFSKASSTAEKVVEESPSTLIALRTQLGVEGHSGNGFLIVLMVCEGFELQLLKVTPSKMMNSVLILFFKPKLTFQHFKAFINSSCHFKQPGAFTLDEIFAQCLIHKLHETIKIPIYI